MPRAVRQDMPKRLRRVQGRSIARMGGLSSEEEEVADSGSAALDPA